MTRATRISTSISYTKVRVVTLLIMMINIITILSATCLANGQVTSFVKTPYDLPSLIVRVLTTGDSSGENGGPVRGFEYNAPTTNGTSSASTPVLFWHGMGDTAWGSIRGIAVALEKQYPGIQVLSVQIGRSSFEDGLTSYFGNVNEQIEQVCREILINDKIRAHGSFNAVGFSQGCQFLRGLIQRCPFREHGIRVKNFVSLGGQHQGVYGLPKCNPANICDYVRYLLTTAAYEKDVQNHIVQAQYWHDPLNEARYKKDNIFIADLNNEQTFNTTYKENLTQLDKLLLVMFEQDEYVVPRESSFFGFYRENGTKSLMSLEESNLYTQDRIGLKELNESGRLKMLKVPGQHMNFKIKWFLGEVAKNYLNN